MNGKEWMVKAAAGVLAAAMLITSLPISESVKAEETEELIVNGGFENGTNNWSSYGESTITADTDNVYSGSGAVKVSSRKSVYAGICQDITGKVVSGGIYQTSVWLKTESDAETPTMNVCIYFGEQYTDGGIRWLATGGVTKGSYTKVTGEFTIPREADLSRVRIYVEGSDTADFYIDDISMQKTGDATIDTTFVECNRSN